MKFLFRGRVGKKILYQDLEAPSVEAAIEEAERRLEEYRDKESRDEPVLAQLSLDLLPVWTVGNYRAPGGF